MALDQLIYPADLAPVDCCPECGPHPHPHPHPVPPCPPPPPPYPYPYPPYAWLVPPPPPAGYPFPPRPDEDDDDNPDTKPNKIERQICKLSRKAATLRSLIENLQDKNKDCIVKSGAVSYNLGPLKVKDEEGEEKENESIDTIINILKAELEKVKEEIKELSDEIVVED